MNKENKNMDLEKFVRIEGTKYFLPKGEAQNLSEQGFEFDHLHTGMGIEATAEIIGENYPVAVISKLYDFMGNNVAPEDKHVCIYVKRN